MRRDFIAKLDHCGDTGNTIHIRSGKEELGIKNSGLGARTPYIFISYSTGRVDHGRSNLRFATAP